MVSSRQDSFDKRDLEHTKAGIIRIIVANEAVPLAERRSPVSGEFQVIFREEKNKG